MSMADTTKLSVEKAIEKLRGKEQPQSRTEQQDDKTKALNEQIKRMRLQRLRLDQNPGKRR
jgi:hypothetical protein